MPHEDVSCCFRSRCSRSRVTWRSICDGLSSPAHPRASVPPSHGVWGRVRIGSMLASGSEPQAVESGGNTRIVGLGPHSPASRCPRQSSSALRRGATRTSHESNARVVTRERRLKWHLSISGCVMHCVTEPIYTIRRSHRETPPGSEPMRGIRAIHTMHLLGSN